MNEEQADELLRILCEIRDALKDKQVIKEVERVVRPATVERLLTFKNYVTSNDFWITLTKEQKAKLLSI